MDTLNGGGNFGSSYCFEPILNGGALPRLFSIAVSYYVEPWRSMSGSRPQMMQPAAEKSLVEGPKVELSMCDSNLSPSLCQDIGKPTHLLHLILVYM